MNHLRAIIVVDDSESDRELIHSCLSRAGAACPVHLLADGSEALAYLAGEGHYGDRNRFAVPSLVFTDLKMLGVDGFDVLDYVRSMPHLRHIPVVVLSGSQDASDIEVAYAHGVSGYIVKSSSLEDLLHRLKVVLEYWDLCAAPETGPDGVPKRTESRDKLGERFRHGANRV